MRISDWSSDVCSADLRLVGGKSDVSLGQASGEITDAFIAEYGGLDEHESLHTSGHRGRSDRSARLITVRSRVPTSSSSSSRRERSEGRRVGKGCVSTGRSGVLPYS